MAQLRGEGYRIFIVRGELPDIDLATSFRDPTRIHYIDKVVQESKTGFPSAKKKTKREIDPEVSRAIAASLKDLNRSNNVVVDDEDEDEDMLIARALAMSSTSAPHSLNSKIDSDHEKEESEEEESEDDEEELARAIALSTSPDVV
jgi:hypothetical protein